MAADYQDPKARRHLAARGHFSVNFPSNWTFPRRELSPAHWVEVLDLGRNMTSQPTPTSKTILVAEDEVLVRHDISEYLRSHGFEVVVANSAAEAIQVLKDSIEVPWCLLTCVCPGPWTALIWRDTW